MVRSSIVTASWCRSEMHESHASIEPESSRLRVLSPLFDKLHAWNERIPGVAGDRPAAVLVGGRRLTVEPWEREQIARWPTGDADAASERCRLVMEGLACMAKTLSDMELRERPTGAERQAELMLDSAIGMALLREIQHVIDLTVARGALEEAKRWGSLQHRMHHTIEGAMSGVPHTEHPRVKQLADTLTELSSEDPLPSPPLAGPSTGPVTETRTDESVESWSDPLAGVDEDAAVRDCSPQVEFSGRTRLLGLVFAVSFVLCGLSVWLPSTGGGDLASVGPAELGDAGLFQAVVSRPPSLYVDVDGAAWDGLTHVQKWRRVEQAVDLATPLGYQGVLLRDASGRAVAQWLRGRGIALLDDGGPSSKGSAFRLE